MWCAIPLPNVEEAPKGELATKRDHASPTPPIIRSDVLEMLMQASHRGLAIVGVDLQRCIHAYSEALHAAKGGRAVLAWKECTYSSEP